MEDLRQSMFNVELGDTDNFYTYNTLMGSYYSGLIDLNSSTSICDLQMYGFIVQNNLDEKEVLRFYYNSVKHDKQSATIVIAPTLDCNFRCLYCYERKLTDRSIMKENIYDDIVNFIHEQYTDYKCINILWYGGEPLLNISAIKTITTKLNSLFNTKKMKYSMVTNGFLLTKNIANELINLGINDYVISLDGPARTHNRLRIYKNGNNSYETILNNINEICMKAKVTIRVNIDKNNINYIEELIHDLEIVNILDKVNILIAPIEAIDINDEHFRDYGTKLYTDDFDKMIRPFIGKKVVTFSHSLPKLNICNAAKNSDITIGPAGELYKCAVQIGNKNCQIGSIYDNEISNRLLNWYNFTPTLKSDCSDCKYIPICYSMCPRNIKIDCRNMEVYFNKYIDFIYKGYIK